MRGYVCRVILSSALIENPILWAWSFPFIFSLEKILSIWAVVSKSIKKQKEVFEHMERILQCRNLMHWICRIFAGVFKPNLPTSLVPHSQMPAVYAFTVYALNRQCNSHCWTQLWSTLKSSKHVRIDVIHNRVVNHRSKLWCIGKARKPSKSIAIYQCAFVVTGILLYVNWKYKSLSSIHLIVNPNVWYCKHFHQHICCFCTRCVRFRNITTRGLLCSFYDCFFFHICLKWTMLCLYKSNR